MSQRMSPHARPPSNGAARTFGIEGPNRRLEEGEWEPNKILH
jgi:hypothetical protein